MPLIVTGLSHKTAPLEIRERFSAASSLVSEVLPKLLLDADLDEAFLISTCNRTELYLVCRNKERGEILANEFFDSLEKISSEKRRHLFYQLVDGAALGHLFRVTASLDAMVVGETQVTGQVKDAYERAKGAGTVGPYLNKLVQRSLEVAKRIRTETEISSHPVSVSSAAVNLAENIFGDLKERTVLIVGSGEMAQLAAQHFGDKIKSLTITNRTESKAREMAASFNAGLPAEALAKAGVLPYEKFQESLGSYDVIVTSTSAGIILTPDLVEAGMSLRKNHPLFLIDIAVPRNIDPAVNKIPNVYLYDIDDLQGVVQAGMAERAKEAKKAEAIIFDATVSFEKEMDQRKAAPTITELSRKFEGIREAEVAKVLRCLPQLGDRERKELEACTKRIVSKILHEPIVGLKEEEGSSYAETVRRLFKLGTEN